MLDFLLTAFDLMIYFLFPEDGTENDDESSEMESPPGGASSRDVRMIRALKVLKSVRAIRIVIRAVRMYRAKLKADSDKEEAELSSNKQLQELDATISRLCANQIPDLLYSLIEHAGDDTLSQELAQRAYTFATLLLEQPLNREVYGALQARSKANDKDGTFFGETLLWDAGVYAFHGAVSVFSGT